MSTRCRKLLLLGVFLVAAAAAGPVLPGAAAAGTLPGAGTPASPYLISSDADLDTAAAMVNADTAHTGAAVADYELTTNLDYSTDTATKGEFSGLDWFGGTFDGAGHTIANLTYAQDGYAPSDNPAAGSDLGFVRLLNVGTIKNLTLSTVTADWTPNQALGQSATSTSGAVSAVADFDFGSAIEGVNVAGATNLSSTSTAKYDFVAGLAAYAYGLSVSDYESSGSVAGTWLCPAGITTSTTAAPSADVPDGHPALLENDKLSGSVTAAWHASGTVGQTHGPVTIEDNDIGMNITDDGTPGTGSDGNGEVSAASEIWGYMPGSDMCWSGTDPSGWSTVAVTIENNAITGGSMTFPNGGKYHFNPGTDQNLIGAFVGHTTYGDEATTFSSAGDTGTNEWQESGDLQASGFSISGTNLTNAPEYTNTGAGGVPIPNGAISAVTPTASFSQQTFENSVSDGGLGWYFGNVDAADPSAWMWNTANPSNRLNPASAPALTVGDSVVATDVGADPSDATVLAAAGATTDLGALATISIDTSNVNFDTAGTYTATVTAANQGLTSSAPLTVIVAPAGQVPLAASSLTVEASKTAQTESAVLAALGAQPPLGESGPVEVDLSSVQWDTPGSYPVQVTDTADGLTPAQATIVVAPPPVVTVAQKTLEFTPQNLPTAAQVLQQAGPQMTDSSGNVVGDASFTADLSQVGSTTGVYTATITGTDPSDGFVASAQVTVDIGGVLVSNTTPVFQVSTASAAPTEAQVLKAMGAEVIASANGGVATVDLSGIDFGRPGEYPVTVTDSQGADGFAPVSATVEVVPVSVVALAHATVFVNTSTPPTTASVLSASGAAITDGSGNAVHGSLAASLPSGCGASAGSCTATVAGTDMYGFTVAPVSVTVDVSGALVSVTNGTATFGAGQAAPAPSAITNALGAKVLGSSGGGTPVVDTSGVSWDTPGVYPVLVSDSDADDAAGTVTAEIRIVPVPVVKLGDLTVFVPVSDSSRVSPALLLANAGATLTDGQGNAIDGTLSADTSLVNGSVAGAYRATIAGTDGFGVQSAPVPVTVVIYALSSGASAAPAAGGKTAKAGPIRLVVGGRAGQISATVTCPGATRSCSGTVTLTTSFKYRAGTHRPQRTRYLSLGHASFKVAGGKSRSVVVGLNAEGRRLLHAGKSRLRVRVLVSARDSAGRKLARTMFVVLHPAGGAR